MESIESINWPRTLEWRRGSAHLLGGIDILYDFDWAAIIGHSRSEFKGGMRLAQLAKEQCPENLTPALLLTTLKDVERFVPDDTYFLPIVRIDLYLNSPHPDPARAYFAQTSGGLSILGNPHRQDEALKIITDSASGRRATSSALSQRLPDRILDARDASDRFAAILNDPTSKETDCQRFIANHPWIIGLDYATVTEKQAIGRGELDFVLERYDGYHDLMELKGPDTPIISVSGSSRAGGGLPPPSHYSLSPKLANALAQAHAYREILYSSEQLHQKEWGLNVRELKIFIVIGRRDRLDSRGKDILDQLNRSLHRVEIIPYDVLEKRARFFLDNIAKHLQERQEDDYKSAIGGAPSKADSGDAAVMATGLGSHENGDDDE